MTKIFRSFSNFFPLIFETSSDCDLWYSVSFIINCDVQSAREPHYQAKNMHTEVNRFISVSHTVIRRHEYN
jgi:hypothetical protein